MPPLQSPSRRHIYKWLDIHNVSRRDKTDRYSAASSLKASFDTAARAPAVPYAAHSKQWAAYRVAVVHWDNCADELQISCWVFKILARCNRLMRAFWVSVREAEANAGRAIRTRSKLEAIFGSKFRTASRRSRLVRFRCTAVPTVLPAAIPTRICD